MRFPAIAKEHVFGLFGTCHLSVSFDLLCCPCHPWFYRLLSKFSLSLKDWGGLIDSNTKLFNRFAHLCQPSLYILLFCFILLEDRDTKNCWCLRWVHYELHNSVVFLSFLVLPCIQFMFSTAMNSHLEASWNQLFQPEISNPSEGTLSWELIKYTLDHGMLFKFSPILSWRVLWHILVLLPHTISKIHNVLRCRAVYPVDLDDLLRGSPALRHTPECFTSWVGSTF